VCRTNHRVAKVKADLQLIRCASIAGGCWRLWMLIPKKNKKIGFVWICGIVGVDPSPNDHLTSPGYKFFLSA